MNSNNVIYTQTDHAINRFFAKIYGLVGIGIALSAFVSFLMLYVFTDNMINIISYHPVIYYGAIFLELILVFSSSNVARKNSPLALPLFLVYSALNGFTLSFVIATYTQTTVVQAFVSSAIVFGVMALIGVVIKRDLSGIAKALIAGVVGIIIASFVNIFIGSGMISYIISIISVVIFSGLIAYDNQMIKRVYERNGGNVGDGWAISMALSLYLDFINLFLNFLRLFGNKE